MAFLPITKAEMEDRGWTEPDFVLVTGDAYVDHPTFGHAVIGRVLESRGYRVAILSQPDWHSAEEFKRFGKPRLGFLLTSGNVDSMVNHYSVSKNRRKADRYSPGGKTGARPDRALIVYSNRAKEAYQDAPIILGGIEASLRRTAHYDYWENRIRRSILLDSKADLLVYGMGEQTILEIAESLDSGISVEDITWVKGTAYIKRGTHETLPIGSFSKSAVELPSFEEITESKKKYAESFRIQYQNQDAIHGHTLIEPYGESNFLIVNPPTEPLSTMELDDVFELPYEGTYHPAYEVLGGVPAIEEVKFSIVANRGCYGGCAFCAITYHQGREVRGRSKESIVKEATLLTKRADFKGYIHDIGGPTANFHQPGCEHQLEYGVCKNKECLYPMPCKKLVVGQKEYLEILRAVRGLPGVKKAFVRSGLRYDAILAEPDDEFLEELCKHHISGVLKVAPEHISNRVLSRMRKPSKAVFIEFAEKYRTVNERIGKKQYLIPYLISSHPGSELKDAIELALFLKEWGFIPDQVQDFYPTPGTLSTCMYYTGLDPITGEEVYVPRDPREKQLQRALLHFHKKENQALVREALEKAGRRDLIGVLR